jgi:creatinine amidohydrolase/Fe(II)-dependent formamide hydrolase-like protein/7-cyano-7-deazaguanine synthase in queuosine biosynthesis
MEQYPEKKSRPNEGSGEQHDPLSVLEVFDVLEVGPVKLESRKLTMPYRLHYNGVDDTTELVYSYEEDVFTGNDASLQNLAGMVGAQVAINYGLFCKEIVFHGNYDDTDRRFILDAAENTAREIYIKKFLEPNPFITGHAADLPGVKMQKYSRAKLVFPEQETKPDKLLWRFLSAESDRHCILSSGGKDSLLSYGLLNELGKETHPIFVNESGRHWFTALNAYRYFKDNIPNTARVWVNSDRIFNWMLRHMQFIRKDYANIRSDEYPIRLWTVAVFLFGALPLMRKRNIGRLIIGDEYDTTDRTAHAGITHYNGLYDQSRYFDDALSRYYMRKGWDIAQFSILRPLSEMLIQKVLVKRYPELQENQVSCHATHEQDKRVYPCGKCEKCRRIVGMLTALDADPRKCGYTDEQIKSCLNDIVAKRVHQEAPGLEHLNFMLDKKGVVKSPPETAKHVREHPVILKLRFHPEKSPMTSIPVDLRAPLYRIILEYADGAVRRIKRKWVEIDPFTDPAIIRPYPFEMTVLKRQKHQKQLSQPVKIEYLWGELTWPEAEQKLKNVDVALLPVGAIEQHGPHLTLDVDAFDAEYLARRVADACSDPQPLVLPTLSYGVSYHHEEFAGTISIGNETLARLVYEIGMSVSKNGIKKLVIINGHGGNSPALNYAAQMINRDAKIFACVDTGETSDVDINDFIETPNDVHAGEIETSTSLATRPHLVKMELAQKLVPEFSSRYLNFTSKRGVSWYAHTEKISPTGVMGDPTRANAEKGKKIWEIMIAHLVAFVEDLKTLTLEEIYQRRY